MRIISKIYLVVILLCLSGCGALKSVFELLPVNVDLKRSLEDYKYFYIIPTGNKSGTTGSLYNYGYGTYGSTTQASINPADIISGFLTKKGYIRIPELPGQCPEKTFIVNYGESGRRDVGIWGYTLETTIQFISVSTNEVLCTVSGEGMGSTEADDIRISINRCMQSVFENQ